MNYVDDEYIIDILPGVLKRTSEGSIEIQFPEGRIEPRVKIPNSLSKSIKFASEWLPRHIKSHKLDSEKISDVKMKIKFPRIGSKSSIYGLECIITCVDDKGKQHKATVNQRK